MLMALCLSVRGQTITFPVAAPTGAGGSSGQVQFKNGSSMDGADNITSDGTNLFLSAVSVPTVSTADVALIGYPVGDVTMPALVMQNQPPIFPDYNYLTCQRASLIAAGDGSTSIPTHGMTTQVSGTATGVTPSGGVYYTVTNRSNGAVAEGFISSDIPAPADMLRPVFWTVNSTSSAASFDFCRINGETY